MRASCSARTEASSIAEFADALLNVVANYEDAAYKHDSLVAECDREAILGRYRWWHQSLQEVFAAGQLWYKWALYDHDPIPASTPGRVTILRDAAHPMLPCLGQGAGQAIEDGCVLAAALDKLRDDPVGALQLYERSRRPRASRIVLTSRAWGDEIRIAAREGFRGDVAGRGEAWTSGVAADEMPPGWIAEYDAGSPEALVD